jgi:hypothetical protein
MVADYSSVYSPNIQALSKWNVTTFPSKTTLFHTIGTISVFAINRCSSWNFFEPNDIRDKPRTT